MTTLFWVELIMILLITGKYHNHPNYTWCKFIWNCAVYAIAIPITFIYWLIKKLYE